MSKKEIKQYLASIGRRGGKAGSDKQTAARASNIEKVNAKRRIADEFSHLTRQQRYIARKRKKMAENGNNA